MKASRYYRMGIAVLAVALAASFGVAGAEVVSMYSGNGTPGNPDPQITYTSGPAVVPLSGAPFTAADFAAASSGPNATIISFVHPLWNPALTCQPAAQWVGIDLYATPASTLFAQNFNVQTCCIGKATLSFCWSSDDYLGDPSGPNIWGVYINGGAVPIAGGSYATTSSGSADVTALVRCGLNTLYVYDRDGAAAVSGAMYYAVLDIQECTVHVEETTWSRVKALYR